MSAGFAGDVSRADSMTVEPNKQHATTPVLGFGLAVMLDVATGSVRQIAAADSAAEDIYGILVRFYPGQAGNPPGNTLFAAQPLGWAVPPPPNMACDVLRRGYIMSPVVGVPRKGDPLFVWAAASGGGHVQGGFEAAETAGSTLAITWPKTQFASGPDAYGMCELAFNI